MKQRYAVVAFILITFLLYLDVRAANILFYSPTLGFSHVEFLGRIADISIDAGHQAVLLMPVYDASVYSNGTRRVMHVMRYHAASYDETQWDNLKIKGRGGIELHKDDQVTNSDFLLMARTFDTVCKEMIEDDQLIHNLRQFNFTLAIGELYDGCFTALAYAIGIQRVIAASATTAPPLRYLQRSTIPLSYSPHVFLPFTDSMSFLERCYNLAYSTVFTFFENLQLIRRHRVFRRRFGSNFPQILTLNRRIIKAMIVNGDDFLGYPAPTMPNVIHVYAVRDERHETGSSKLEAVLETASAGVVLVSFGTIFKFRNVDYRLRAAIFDAFSRFCDFNFLVKYDAVNNDVIVGVNNHSNVFVTGWLPQNELLRHHKVRALLTHGGANSVIEAAHAGIPMIVIPLFGDQARNAGVVEKFGVAYRIPRLDLDARALIDGLRAVLGTNTRRSRYTEKAQKLARMLNERRMLADQILVSTINAALKM